MSHSLQPPERLIWPPLSVADQIELEQQLSQILRETPGDNVAQLEIELWQFGRRLQVAFRA